jgi:hypothetical protein
MIVGSERERERETWTFHAIYFALFYHENNVWAFNFREVIRKIRDIELKDFSCATAHNTQHEICHERDACLLQGA